MTNVLNPSTQKQVELCKFEATLVYVVSPRPARVGETLSLKNKGNPFAVEHSDSDTMPVTQYSGGRGKGIASSRPAWAV